MNTPRTPKFLLALAASVLLGASRLVAAEAPDSKGFPLPVHDLEGNGGGAITPTAYLTNAGGKDTVVGLPALSLTGIYIGHGRALENAAITETFFGRLELGYGIERFLLGDTQDHIKQATGVTVRDDVYLHNFSARVLVLPENSFGTDYLPALTLGGTYKYNDGIASINHDLGNALTGLGYRHQSGEDYTLTASKTFPKVFGRPLIVSAGLRNSAGAWLGYLGFADKRHTTFEGNVIYVATDWVTFGYEFRQKQDPFAQIPGLVGGENNAHAISAIFTPTHHWDIALVYGILGQVLDHKENHAVALQAKYEF